MNKNLSFRIHPLLAAVITVMTLLTIMLLAYWVTRSASEGEVMGRVTVMGTPIGGLPREQATVAVLGVEGDLLARQAMFTIEGAVVPLDPVEAGFDIDEEAVIDVAMSIGREGNAVYQFLWWLGHIFSSEEVHPTGSADADALEAIFDYWDSEVIAMPASLGAIVMEDGLPRAVYPQTGIGLDRPTSAGIINESLLAAEPTSHQLPTVTVVPKLTATDVDEALLVANQLLAEEITMVYDGSSIVFTPGQLAEAYRSETIAEGTPQIVHTFDPEVIDSFLTAVREDFEAEPVDARFVIEGDDIRIVPGSKGTRIDEAETAEKLLQAGLTSTRLGQLPLVEDADPEVTTGSLEALGIEHLVSSFTTYHDCCQNRVVNIHTIADTIDGQILKSGEQFSVNGFVGERTEAKGYLPGGTIVAGELEETIGGGVSQFATTMYNAIFWGGLEDVEHRPHSYYFSRYPEGIEATINWRTPDLVFRNNTDHAILIDTRHSDTSITVRIFGSNDGRTVKGEQKNGSTNVWVPAEGGPNAIHVKASVSDRHSPTTPGEPRYVANPDLAVDEQIETQKARDGWSVTVTRRLLRGGTDLIAERQWPVRYLPAFAVIEVHPCKMPGQEQTCPSTTTTIPAGSTTTISESTTTTTGG